MKRSLAGGFSNKALLEQEDLVQERVDEFVHELGRAGAGPKGLDIKQWYEMIAFDVLGEMAFGESFHCIENGRSPFRSGKCRLKTLMSTHRKTTLLAADDCGTFVLHHRHRQFAEISTHQAVWSIDPSKLDRIYSGQAFRL